MLEIRKEAEAKIAETRETQFSEYDRHRTPGWSPKEYIGMGMDLFRIDVHEQFGISSYTAAHAIYEKVRYMHLSEGEQVPVTTPNGVVEVSKDQLLDMATFPSELVHSGGFYTTLKLVPASAQAVREAIAAYAEGETLPRELALQYLKYCCNSKDEFTLAGDGIGAKYTWADVCNLIGELREGEIEYRRCRDGVAFGQDLSKTYPEGGPSGRDEDERPYVEALIKALRWPAATATITTNGGAVEVSKEDLVYYASGHSPDVVLYATSWSVSPRRSDGLLPTEQSLYERLKRYKDGETVDYELASDWDRRYNGGAESWVFHSTAPHPTPVKRSHPRSEEYAYIEFVHRHRGGHWR